MLGDDADLDAALRWVDDWQSGIEEQAARARALSQRVAGLSATAASEDGTVEVTVASSGVLTELRLDEAIRRRSAAETAAQILAVTRTALVRLAEQVAVAAEETMGRDSPAGRAVVDSYAKRLFAPAGGEPDAAR